MQQVSDIEKLGGMNEHLPLSQAIIKRYYDYADDLVDTLDKDDIFQTEDGVYQFIGRNEQGEVIANQLRFDYIQQKYYNTHNEKVFPIGIIAKYDDRNNILFNDSSKSVYYIKDSGICISNGIDASWEYNNLELENGDNINCRDIFLTDKLLEEKINVIVNYGKIHTNHSSLKSSKMNSLLITENKGLIEAIEDSFTYHPKITFEYDSVEQPYLNLCFTSSKTQVVIKLFVEQENVNNRVLFTFNGNYDFELK